MKGSSLDELRFVGLAPIDPGVMTVEIRTGGETLDFHNKWSVAAVDFSAHQRCMTIVLSEDEGERTAHLEFTGVSTLRTELLETVADEDWTLFRGISLADAPSGLLGIDVGPIFCSLKALEVRLEIDGASECQNDGR